MRKTLLAVAALPLILAGCVDDATVATENIKKAADNFEINRRVVFYNGITDSYILSVEGLCSMDLNGAGTAFNVICKTGPSDTRWFSPIIPVRSSSSWHQPTSVPTTTASPSSRSPSFRM